MTIINDVITFVDADFSGLTELAQAALAASPLGANFAAELSLQATARVASAKGHLKSLKAQDPLVDSILGGLSTAGPVTLAAAQPLLVDLDNLLNP